MKQQIQKKSGFTLAELLVVVAIIAVLVAVSIPIFTGALAKSKTNVCEYNRYQLVRTLELIVLTEGRMPTADDAKNADMALDTLCPSGGTCKIELKNGSSLNVSCSIHEGSGNITKPDDTMYTVHVFDPETGKYVEIPVQGTGVGSSSADLYGKIIYYPGSDKFPEGYYLIKTAQYSSNIKDIDAYLEIILGWSKHNFTKIDPDQPIQTYDAAKENSKKPNSSRNSSVVKGQFYYIDFTWDDVDGPVLALYNGSTTDTWWRGDLSDNTKWPTNKGVWIIVK